MIEQILAKTRLFDGISVGDISEILSCLNAKAVEYAKDEAIFRAGDTITHLGLVLSGAVNIEHDDVWGNRSILGRIEAGSVFGETYACAPERPLMVSAIASERSKVMLLGVSSILHACPTSCERHRQLIRSLLKLSAEKNLMLSSRMMHITPKTIRGRLLSYLSEQAGICGSYSFAIPFDRQQLADYLNVDRSALSAELSKLKSEGALDYRKNRFTILQEQDDF